LASGVVGSSAEAEDARASKQASSNPAEWVGTEGRHEAEAGAGRERAGPGEVGFALIRSKMA